MVEIIGLVTISALVWVLAWSMAGESDAERRRIGSAGCDAPSGKIAGHVLAERRAA